MVERAVEGAPGDDLGAVLKSVGHGGGGDGDGDEHAVCAEDVGPCFAGVLEVEGGGFEAGLVGVEEVAREGGGSQFCKRGEEGKEERGNDEVSHKNNDGLSERLGQTKVFGWLRGGDKVEAKDPAVDKVGRDVLFPVL
jgi:hypothetical protein